MKLESTANILDFDPKEIRTQAEATHNLGERVALADNRSFRYAKAGASNISLGKLQLAPAQNTNHHNIAVAAAAALGAKSVSVTLGATAAAANEYAEGYLVVNDAAGEGGIYKISGHAAIASSGTGSIDLFDPIAATALTTSSEVSLVHNSFNAVVEGTVQTRRAAGIPLVSITAGDFGWLQTRGVAPALADETVTVGEYLVPGSSVAGAVEAALWQTEATDASRLWDEQTIGCASIMALVDTEYRPIFLTID